MLLTMGQKTITFAFYESRRRHTLGNSRPLAIKHNLHNFAFVTAHSCWTASFLPHQAVGRSRRHKESSFGPPRPHMWASRRPSLAFGPSPKYATAESAVAIYSQS